MFKSIFVAAALAAVLSANAQSFSDNFNRADSGTLGSNWTLVSSSTQVINNAAENGAGSLGLSTVNGFNAAPGTVTLSADITAGNSLGYVALLLGYLDSNPNDAVFVKVQSASGGSFGNYAFYTGNNNNVGLSGFFSLNSTFTTAHMVVWMSNSDTVNLGLDTNGDGIYDQQYSSAGVSGLTLGTGVGLGLYGDATADNFSASATPEPATFAMVGLGALALLRRRRRA